MWDVVSFGYVPLGPTINQFHDMLEATYQWRVWRDWYHYAIAIDNDTNMELR